MNNFIYLSLLIVIAIGICMYDYTYSLDGFKDNCDQPEGTNFTYWSSKWWNPSLKKVPYEDMSTLGSMGTF
jgi:hypothetical protein